MDDGDEELDGLYSHSEKTIYVNKALPAERRWEVYRHELMHALNDILAEDKGLRT